jgi:hypothetical protein
MPNFARDMFIFLSRGERYRKKLWGKTCVLNEFQREQERQQTSEQGPWPVGEPVAPNLVEDSSTPLALNQYVDFDSECSGLFSDQDIEAAKRLMKDG